MYLGGVKPSLLELIEALVEEENLTRRSLDESLMEQYDPLRGRHQQKRVLHSFLLEFLFHVKDEKAENALSSFC